tara:strand:- start:2544 stop:2867 length:324 start_codon:yes stop_codon:yes gene_type:complete
MTAILRDATSVTVLCSDAVADSESFDFRDFSSGTFLFGNAPGTTEIHVSQDDVTYFKLVGQTGDDVTITNAGANEAVSFPDELFSAHYVKLKTSDGTDRNVTVLLKG